MDDETRRVGEIEAEIAETRVELTETIEAIQERLSPSNMVSQATESVRQAATQKVRAMTDNSFMETVRANPIPAAMIGIGAAWLYWKGRSDSRGDSRYARGYSRNVDRYDPGSYGESAGAGGYAVGTAGRAAYADVSDIESVRRDDYGSTTGDVTYRAREMAAELRDSARDTTRRAQLKFNDVLRDNPLMLGAAAALVGAAVGMSIPETETENRLMGETRDAVVDRAQHLASDATSKVSEAAAGSVQEAAGKVADTAQNLASRSATNTGGAVGSTSTSRSSSRRRSTESGGSDI